MPQLSKRLKACAYGEVQSLFRCPKMGGGTSNCVYCAKVWLNAKVKLDFLKGEKDTSDSDRLKALKTYARYSSLVFQMVALGLVGYLVGRRLDAAQVREASIYTGLCTLAGVVIGLFLFLRAVLKRHK